MIYAQAALSAAIFLLLPLLDLPTLLRLRRYTSSPARIHTYRKMLVIVWSFTAAALLLAPFRTLFFLHPAASWLTAKDGPHGTAVAFVSALFLSALSPGILCLLRPSIRPKYAKASAGMRFLLPVTQTERRLWLFVSLSAGLCEELLYRGFLFGWLGRQFIGGHPLSWIAALIMSSIGFGLAHSYQGALGVIQTTLIGAGFALMAVLTGSLALPMLVHALIDAQVLAMYRPALDTPEEAVALIAGLDLQTARMAAS